MKTPRAAALPPRRPDVVCEGDHREMGRRQGEALRPQILAVREALEQLEVFRLLQPWWLPYGLYRRWAEGRAWRMLAEPLRGASPASFDRLLGLAEGSRLAPRAAALLNACEAVMSSMRGKFDAPMPLPGACSAVAVRGPRSSLGEPVIARNFDYLPLAQPFFILRESRPRGGARSLDFTVAPLLGAVDGMNELGLCITYNYAYTTDAPAAAPPISAAISEALERCRTVAEAAEWIASRPRWGGGLLMLADASGDIASLELSNGRSALRRPPAGGHVLVHTNSFHMDETRKAEVPPQAVFSQRAPGALRGKRVLESGEARLARIAELLNGERAVSPSDLAAVMSDHGPDGKPGGLTPCVHSPYWTTTASIQFFPKSRRVRLDFANTCRAVYSEASL